MSENEFGDFIACVPQNIKADWDEKWGPLLAEFPLNIMYACVQRAESDHHISRDQEDPRVTYFNREGGTYRVRVVLHRASGRLETFKYKGRKLVACASGRDFDSAMVQTTLVGIERDEPVTVVRD